MKHAITFSRLTTLKSAFASRFLRVLLSCFVTMTAGLALSGCAVGQLGGMLGGGVMGANKEVATTWEPKVSEERLLAAAIEGAGPAMTGTTGTSSCPSFAVWGSDKQVTIYEIGRVGDNKAVLHRGEITKTARECSYANGQMTIKYGVAGRVLLGVKGRPGPVRLPVSIFVTDGNRVKVKTDKFAIATMVPTEKPYGYFSEVRKVTFKLPEGHGADNYKVYVAFDRSEPGAG